MPAHGARSTIGVRIKSNDAPVSALDWRGNRLADAAAKAGAAAVRIPASARILRARFLNAYEHALAELSAVTVAANRHESQGVSIDGTIVRLIKRDASSMPHSKRPRIVRPDARLDSTHGSLATSATVPSVNDPLLTPVGMPQQVKRVAARTRDSHPAKRRRMARDHVTICVHRELKAWHSARSERAWLPISDTRGTASDRLAALRGRLASRLPPP